MPKGEPAKNAGAHAPARRVNDVVVFRDVTTKYIGVAGAGGRFLRKRLRFSSMSMLTPKHTAVQDTKSVVCSPFCCADSDPVEQSLDFLISLRFC